VVTDSANYDEPRNARRIRDLSIQKTKELRRLRGGGSLLRKVLVASVLVKSHNAVIAESAGSKSDAESSEKLSSDSAESLSGDGNKEVSQPVTALTHQHEDEDQTSTVDSRAGRTDADDSASHNPGRLIAQLFEMCTLNTARFFTCV